ncbi:MAG: hypothetical protein BYD32DRAFT_425611 [Podila humilis]|nr:MAG: hypothetical protein BYD32DRAFT_425611 [Podila humilis]
MTPFLFTHTLPLSLYHSVFVTLSLFSLFSCFPCVTNQARFSPFDFLLRLLIDKHLPKFNFFGLFDPMTSTPHRTRYWTGWRKTLTLFLFSTRNSRVVVGE